MITVVGNLKGGSGKSTVTFNLAIWLAKAKRNVISFDLDPQATLMDVAEVRDEEGYLPKIKVFQADSDPGSLIRKHEGDVLIDVGASNLWAVREAVNMADRILVPVTPSQADVWSTQRFLNIVANALKGEMPEVIGFINRADTHASVRESDETEEALALLPGITVLKKRLCQRTAFRRCFSEGRAVFEASSSGKASKEFREFAKALFDDTGQGKK
uniref:Chromosome partitioning protein n=2 Tax=unclassified Candidatus Kentrum TaxID=2643149 RepID=A0A451AW86_9GAMM|nr:MAG: chromosome partitioning protein [Candidatus Kentron sp. LPFa]VFK62144.1 MAG: chromosome partitioning protein [Candidatus Kentron sp. UNK]VFK70292.1 MAG: chromosome partitioning protein [Candidatus Kentron sp. UNK]